jgi:hypothetical protein
VIEIWDEKKKWDPPNLRLKKREYNEENWKRAIEGQSSESTSAPREIIWVGLRNNLLPVFGFPKGLHKQQRK